MAPRKNVPGSEENERKTKDAPHDVDEIIPPGRIAHRTPNSKVIVLILQDIVMESRPKHPLPPGPFTVFRMGL